jgi:CubicO group peptidase (beta-lactamase class C family)
MKDLLRMRSYRLPVILALLFWSSQVEQLLAQRRESGQRVVRMLEQTRAAAHAPAISAAVVVNDRLVWSGGVGQADLENEVPATGQTVYRVASISKPIAATAVMQLVEQNKVSLDDPIQEYVPTFPTKGDTPLTVRHVLTHTSGIRHYKPGEFLNHRRFHGLERAIEIFKDDPLLFAPGEKMSYSTYAFNLMAGVVETASEMDFEEYMTRHVYQKAGMTSTHFEHLDQIVPHRARGYITVGRDKQIRNAPYADLSIKWAGGGMISTAEDLARFHIAMNDGKLLKAETMQAMYTPARLNNGKPIGFGLAWRVRTDRQGVQWVYHSGGSTGATTFLLRCPERSLAVALLCNLEKAKGLSELAQRIADTASSEFADEEASLPVPADRGPVFMGEARVTSIGAGAR